MIEGMQGWVWSRHLTPELLERGPGTGKPQMTSKQGQSPTACPAEGKGAAFLQREPN